MPYIRRQNPFLTIALAVFDCAGILAAFLLAAYLTRPAVAPFYEHVFGHVAYFVIFAIVWCSAAVDHRLFVSRRGDDFATYLLAVMRAVSDALVLSVFVAALFSQSGLERDFLLSFCISALLTMLAFRAVLRLGLWNLRRRGFNFRYVLIVGANDRAARLVKAMTAHPRYGYRLEGFLDDDPERAAALQAAGLTSLGRLADLETVLLNRVIDEVYITLPVRSFYQTIQNMSHQCEAAGVPVRLLADLFPLQIATSRLMHMEDIPLLSLSAIPESQGQLALKRLIDLVVSSLLLVGMFPVFLAIGILIKLDSKGPVFFRQERVGLNQRRFKMIKFRSMIVNAEELRKSLEAYNEADGPVFKIRNDPRITRVGRFIRRFSLDEFPQLINVWLGQMSLVGPRPPIPSEVEKYSWDQRRRLSVKPGMTGLWQVSGRSDVAFEEWVEMDLAYIDSWSLAEDFRILFKTFHAVVFGRGAA
ncbi:MAG: sugar transferase [Candidatus Hydrogenedentes bacterium]|nr:sugar transferase [Candidatus Hydrogenedentota bacterium]